MVQLDLLLLNHNIALVPRLGVRMATCAIGQHRELQTEDEEDFMAVGALSPSIVQSLMARLGWELVHNEIWRGWLPKNTQWRWGGFEFRRSRSG